MLKRKRLRIAIQKKGRLSKASADFLLQCGLQFSIANRELIVRSHNFPIDILLVRDDDIPSLVIEGVCDLGVVGKNVLLESELKRESQSQSTGFHLLTSLNFGVCRLSIALPKESRQGSALPSKEGSSTEGSSKEGSSTEGSLEGLRIATSYPHVLQRYLKQRAITAEILSISGSVEIAPALGMADAVCDLVSTGKTLKENGLVEVATVLNSQAVLIQSPHAVSAQWSELLPLFWGNYSSEGSVWV